MKKNVLLIIFSLLLGSLFAQFTELNIWNNIRNSSYTQDDQIFIRCETLDMPNIQTEMFYMIDDEWISTEMNNIGGLTMETEIDLSQEDTAICRFRSGTDTLVAMMPAYIENDLFPPDIDLLSEIISDPAGDTLMAGIEQLDMLGTYFGYSDTRFYIAIKNNGSGFPTDEGGWLPFEYYVYMAGIINPESILEDSTAYAIVYTQVLTLFQPGLYRMTGTDLSLDNLQQIAEIETAVVDSFLILSCAIDDLVNDEFFGDWPSMSRSLGLEFLNLSVGLTPEFEFTFNLVDISMPSLQVIDQYIIEPFDNVLPTLSNISAVTGTASTVLEVEYFDENFNFPLVAQAVVDQNDTYDLQPLSFDFSQPVTYFLEIPTIEWDSITLFFTDNGFQYVEDNINNTSLNDNIVVNSAFVRNYPNPFNPITIIEYNIPNEQKVDLGIYNAKGQLLEQVLDQQLQSGWNTISWNGEKHPSGVYFYKLEYRDVKIINKMVMLK